MFTKKQLQAYINERKGQYADTDKEEFSVYDETEILKLLHEISDEVKNGDGKAGNFYLTGTGEIETPFEAVIKGLVIPDKTKQSGIISLDVITSKTDTVSARMYIKNKAFRRLRRDLETWGSNYSVAIGSVEETNSRGDIYFIPLIVKIEEE